MNRIQKEYLRQAFEAPAPTYKEEFLRKLTPPRMHVLEFIFSQVGYIRKWVWGIFALVFAAALTGAAVFSVDMLWGISALTPLLALTILSESGRSESYGMAELEMATRFSLRSVIFARLWILGAENLLLLSLLLPIGLKNNRMRPLQAGVYILTPFLLTVCIGLYIFRRCRGREAVCICAGAAVCVSFSVLFFHSAYPQIYRCDHLMWWIAGTTLLFFGTAKQYINILNRMGELTWSL